MEHRREATARLFAELDGACDEEAQRIRDEIVRLNMGVASDCARRYRRRGVATEDLDQVAYLGLVKAVQAFDPARGFDFMSFAVPTIRGEVRRHFRDLGWTLRPPRSIQELQSRILAAESDLAQELGRSPRPSDLALHLGVDLEQVLDALGASGCFAPASLDVATAEGDDPLGERIGGVDPAFATAEARITLAAVMRGPSPRERRTQAEIGADIGVTQMQVSRLLNRILERLRERMLADAEATPSSSSDPAA
jgi:RNA polymerase sigma-B factor